ncbi:hypothetical protein KY284_031659 [Solanum tuberosum]|nr:hypothetical protein KY284_031659 [Solanum tuberosum]
MLDEAQHSLRKATKRMTKYADQHQRALEFQVGDEGHSPRNRLRRFWIIGLWDTAKRIREQSFWFNGREGRCVMPRRKKGTSLWQFEEVIQAYLDSVSLRTMSSSSRGSVLDPQRDGLSGLGLSRVLHYEPSRGPMT